jgi:hypothetical protein
MQALDTVVNLIHLWQPDRFPKELKYRDSLANFLRERLPRAIIEKEYRHSGTTSDLYVECNGFLRTSEVFIELKPEAEQTQDHCGALRRDQAGIADTTAVAICQPCRGLFWAEDHGNRGEGSGCTRGKIARISASVRLGNGEKVANAGRTAVDIYLLS